MKKTVIILHIILHNHYSNRKKEYEFNYPIDLTLNILFISFSLYFPPHILQYIF